MYGKVYEPKKILRKKGRRPFPKEVVKEVNNGEDLFSTLFVQSIKEIKQHVKYEKKTERNGKTEHNIVTRSNGGGFKVIEPVRCEELMDSFDALLEKPSCQHPEQEVGTEQDSKSIDKYKTVCGRSKRMRKKPSVLLNNKENMPNYSSPKSLNALSVNYNDESKGISLKFFTNKVLEPFNESRDVESINHKRNARKKLVYKQNLNDSYVDSYLQSSDEFVDRESSFLQTLLPRTLSQDCSKKKSSDGDCNLSNVVSCPVYKTTESSTKFSHLTSTPARCKKHSNYVSCSLSPISPVLSDCCKANKNVTEENVVNDAAEKETIHELPSDTSTHSIISGFKDLSLSSEISNSVSNRNGTVTVNQSRSNSGREDTCQRNLYSPDPFMETIITEDHGDGRICDKNSLSIDRREESVLRSDSEETPTVLRGTSERSKSNTNTVFYNSNVYTSSCLLGQGQPTTNILEDSNKGTFSDHFCAEHSTTVLNMKSKSLSKGDNSFCEIIPNSPIVSNVTTMRHGNESQSVCHQKPSHISHCDRGVIEPTILQESSASSCTFIPRRSHAVVPLNVSVGCLPSTGFRELYIGSTALLHSINENLNFSEDDLFSDESNNVKITFENKVLQYCGQTKILGFTEAFPESYLYEYKKIGEGVYGEVFSCQYSEQKCTVLKIIPIEGDCRINGEPQKSYEEILSEIVITMELSNLRKNEDFYTSSFPELINCWCVQGEYSAKLVELWHEYDEKKTSENDSPEILPDDQIYIILELADVGSSLESYTFSSAEQSLSAFMQVTAALAVAEAAYDFEHRDLHWGNILIKPTNNKMMIYKIYDHIIEVECHRIQASVIDFTLSRIKYDGCCIYNDLANDPAIFEGNGDYQFDIYRLMKDRTKNNWQVFEPYNNVLWLSYVLRKLLAEVYYRNKKSRVHKNAMVKLEHLNHKILEFKSALEVALSFS